MRIFITIMTLSLLIWSCSKKDNSRKLFNNKLYTNSTNSFQINNKMLDSNIQYIGFIDKFYFLGNKEAYIELYFTKDQTSVDEYDKLVKLADSLVYEDDENSRYKFPDNLSEKYFDLRGLSKINIYDKDNKLFCNANFVRVEYLNQNISSPFIAVFKTDKLINNEGYYGISNFKETFQKTNYQILEDTSLTKNILSKLNEQKPYGDLETNGTHISFSNRDTILSIVNSTSYTFITLTTNNDFKVLYKSVDLENAYDIRIIPLSKYGLPYILTRNVKPETDMYWENLLIYDGRKYKTTNRQRVE